jgi:NAD(P)H-flavin reductase
MVEKLKAKLVKITNLSPTVRDLRFEFEKEFNFEAGQFVNLSFKEGEEILKRPYSIASIPQNKNYIDLCIKNVEGGKVSPKIFEKREGDEFEIMGPLGVFKIRNQKENLYFIGTGTGIAPLRSMILDLLKNKKTEKQITLIFGCRYENEILYEKEFLELEKNNPNFRYIRVVSKPTDNWVGRQGHVQENLDVIKDILNSEFYICGLPAMFEGVKEKLFSLGVSKEDIYHEVFR